MNKNIPHTVTIAIIYIQMPFYWKSIAVGLAKTSLCLQLINGVKFLAIVMIEAIQYFLIEQSRINLLTVLLESIDHLTIFQLLATSLIVFGL